MMNELEKEFQAYYGQFDREHGSLRQSFVASMAKAEAPARVRIRLRGWAKMAVAAAAALLFVIGATMWGPSAQPGGLNGQAAWATVVEQFPRINSIHFTLETPTGDETVQVEMWWRRPHEYRMELPNGLVITSNGEKRCQYDPATDKMLITAPGPGPEMFILGELGGLFAAESELSRDWASQCAYLRTEEFIYKGAQCRKVFCEKDGRLYEYVIDGRVSDEPGGTRMPFYEVKEYSGVKDGRMLSHLQVIEVGADWPSDLFEVVPKPGMSVVDRREE
ncbi:MAG: hypothetical protein JW741_06695 [Sedimentisphaerales bacterium]|nr:hypothetical protein [Sedimentisphaerales bacterium]